MIKFLFALSAGERKYEPEFHDLHLHAIGMAKQEMTMTMRRSGASNSSSQRGKTPFSHLLQPQSRRGIYAQPASEADIHSLHMLLSNRLDKTIASAETACAIQAASPNSIWSIYGPHGLVGGIAFLPLNGLGLYKLIYGKLDFKNPPLDSIAVQSERPAVIYVWALVATGFGVIGLADVLRQLEIQRFRNIDIWAHAVTPQGERLAKRLGMEAFSTSAGDYFKYDRSGQRA